jgi:hypothetical protein
MVEQSGAYQIVEVLSECRLLNAKREEKMYWRRDGSCLAPGFYVVSEPARAAAGRFYEDAQFRGPYGKRESAEAALRELIER